ncbi:SIR2 family protein [Streptomyces massasporeus]|uniref:SIR2 family protein n=1 Tax=Streptomyces massasporeus TaxID=67324 RepID=UPI0033CF211E
MIPRKDESKMIKPESLTARNAFSFTEQPYLKNLFEVVTKGNTKISFVVGAGVSLDAGLPGWQSLINDICKQIANKTFRRLALADRADLMRKAEFVLQMVIRETTKMEDAIICEALYKREKNVVPGELAKAIVRLGVGLGDRARLLTTNFDQVLETALLDYLPESKIESMGLQRRRAWGNRSRGGAGNVLHLHGMVIPNNTSQGPLILSESQFLAAGPDVRKIILKQLENSCVIFVGVSITDPNLTGPLWDARERTITDRPFVLIVPEPVRPSFSDADAKNYALEKAVYLEEKLKMRPIFLKSYSQLIQVFWDLGLAYADPEKYGHGLDSKTVGAGPKYYGVRFKNTLSSCYKEIGCGPGVDWPTGEKARKLSNKLFESLSDKGPVGKLLTEISRRHHMGNEYFGLFLWLRAREYDGNKAPYELNLVGTSTYVHREAWSGQKRTAIVANSAFPAARAVFRGAYLTGNIDSENPNATWRGTLAVPIRIVDASSYDPKKPYGRDIITVGAITLDTNKLVTGPGNIKSTDRSVLWAADRDEKLKLATCLQELAEKILQTP